MFTNISLDKESERARPSSHLGEWEEQQDQITEGHAERKEGVLLPCLQSMKNTELSPTWPFSQAPVLQENKKYYYGSLNLKPSVFWLFK
jgi:hypothetical protein